MIELTFPLGVFHANSKKRDPDQHFLLLIEHKFCQFWMTFRSFDDQTVSRYIRFLLKRAFIFPIHGLEGEVKLINPITLETIREAILAEGLATPGEIDCIIADLYAFANDPSTVASTARFVQTWGIRSQE